MARRRQGAAMPSNTPTHALFDLYFARSTVDVKFHFMDDKVQDSLIAGVSTQNGKVEDKEKIKKLFSWRWIGSQLLRMIWNAANVTLYYTEYPKNDGKGVRPQRD